MTGEGVERRRSDPQIEALAAILVSVNRLHDKLEEVAPTVDEIKEQLRDHIKDEMSLKITAFPDGDPDGHRRAHEAQIIRAEAEAKIAQDRAEIWLTMRKKAAEMTVWAFLIVSLSILVYFWNGHMPPSAQLPMPIK